MAMDYRDFQICFLFFFKTQNNFLGVCVCVCVCVCVGGGKVSTRDARHVNPQLSVGDIRTVQMISNIRLLSSSLKGSVLKFPLAVRCRGKFFWYFLACLNEPYNYGDQLATAGEGQARPRQCTASLA